jgi:hypothetical protein
VDLTPVIGCFEQQSGLGASSKETADITEWVAWDRPPVPSDTKFDVFLSHRGGYEGGNDMELVAAPIDFLLRAYGCTPFFDRDPLGQSMQCGGNGELSLRQGLFSCRIALVFLSPEFFSSEFCVRELRTLLERESDGQEKDIIIPVFFRLGLKVDDDDDTPVGELRRKLRTHNGIEWRYHEKSLPAFLVEITRKTLYLLKRPVPSEKELETKLQSYYDAPTRHNGLHEARLGSSHETSRSKIIANAWFFAFCVGVLLLCFFNKM